MNTDLIINPHIKIWFTGDDRSDFFLSFPQPGYGLQKLAILKAENTRLHALFLELLEFGMSYFDCANDLNESEYEFLKSHGVLVAADETFDRPLFSCHLDDGDVTAIHGEARDLIVNPTFRFEPFNLANFSSWANDRHFSPHQPSVWIRLAGSGTEVGYWLNSDEAAAVVAFRAGAKPPSGLSDHLVSKLLACDILCSPKIIDEREEEAERSIQRAKKEFGKNKYAVLREILPVAQMRALRRFYRSYTSLGFMPFEDPQSSRFYEYREPLASYFHQQLTGLVSKVIDEEAVASYVYAASYVENADLKPHVDRPQCKFSISFQVDYQPEPAEAHSPWALFVTDPRGNHSVPQFPAADQMSDTNSAVYLASGDGLFYMGCELEHYRYPLFADHKSTSLFFHYVGNDFEGELA